MTARSPESDLFSPRRFALFLALLLVAMYYRVLLAGETFYYRDFGVLAIPTAAYHKASLLAGEIPFWNPFSNCGAPFLAQWGTMALYPLSLIYVLLPMPWSLNFFCIAHLWLGGMGMYFLARRWRGESWPAALAGIAFTFNGITQAALAWPNYTAALALFPWVVLAAERVWTRNAKAAGGEVFIAALVSALQLLAGVPELSALTWLVVAALWAARFKTERAPVKRQVLLFGAVVLGAAGLVSAQLFPFFELLQYSHRAPGFAAEKWALPAWGWANFVLPRFHTFVTPEGTAFQYNQAFLSSVYLGAPLLFLAGCAWLARDARVWILGIVAALGAVLALGAAGILYPILTALFPPLSIARYPAKFLFLVAFAIPLLAAFGAQNLARLPHEKRNRLTLSTFLAISALMAALVAINYARPFQYDRVLELRDNSALRWCFAMGMMAAIYFATAGRARVWIPQGALLLLLIADAKTHLNNLNPAISASLFQGNVWASAHDQPKPVLGKGRIFITPAAEARLLESGIADPRQDLTGKRLAEWSHLNLLDRVPKVNGSSTLQLREQALVQRSLYSGTNQNLEAWLDFLNVTLQTSPDSVIRWDSRPAPMPFVTTGQQIVFGDDPLIMTNDFRTEVVIDSRFAEVKPRAAASATLSNVSVTPHEIRFEVNAAAPTVAVIAQSWHPCWRITLENPAASRRDEPLLRANLAFQAALIPPGRTVARVYYNDHSFKLGAAVSGATLLVFALFWVRTKKNALLRNEKSVSL